MNPISLASCKNIIDAVGIGESAVFENRIICQIDEGSVAYHFRDCGVSIKYAGEKLTVSVKGSCFKYERSILANGDASAVAKLPAKTYRNDDGLITSRIRKNIYIELQPVSEYDASLKIMVGDEVIFEDSTIHFSDITSVNIITGAITSKVPN